MLNNSHITIAEWIAMRKNRTIHEYSEPIFQRIQAAATLSLAEWMTRLLGEEFIRESVVTAEVSGSVFTGFYITGGLVEYTGPNEAFMEIELTLPAPQSVDALHWELAAHTYKVEKNTYSTFTTALEKAQLRYEYDDSIPF